MNPEDALEFDGSDGSLFVFGDRIESQAKKRSQTIAFGDIAEVLVANRPKRLIIVTREGKRLQFNIGRESEAARGAIARRMSAAAQ